MNRAGANLYHAVGHPDSADLRNMADIDEHLRLTQAQLHERHEAVSARNQFACPLAGLQLPKRIVHRRGALVVECCGDHARPPWMMRHNFSGRSIMSTCLTPNALKASTAAETIHGVEPRVPASPTPFAPSGFTGVGVTVLSSSKRGR